MITYEKCTKLWAQFLNEKIVKLGIKREQFEATASQLKAKNKIESKSKIVKKKTQERVKLNQFEKLVLGIVKLGISQTDAEASLRNTGMQGEARDLKSLGLI